MGNQNKNQNALLELMRQLGGTVPEAPEEKKAREKAEAAAKKKQEKLEAEKTLREGQLAARKALQKDAEAGNGTADESRVAALAAELKKKGGKAKIKPTPKAAGLKSTFVLNENTLLMTAFGKGNAALPEKTVVGRKVTNISDTPLFSAKAEEKSYQIDGRVSGAHVCDPLQSAKMPGDDMIHCRKALEKSVFGKEFKDNLHIQQIYNILDIEKILALHINNIVFALNNLLRKGDAEFDEFIGNLNLQHTYENFIKNKSKNTDNFNILVHRPQLGYFGIEITDLPEKKAKKPAFGKAENDNIHPLEMTMEDFYYALCIIGATRQMLAHGTKELRGFIYSLDDGGKKNEATKKAMALLDLIYNERVDDLNRDFLNKAKKDLVILFRAYNVTLPQEKKKYVTDYYNFIVRKEYKNQGFSIKLLREEITASIPEAAKLKDKAYDSVRQKLNRFFDFAVYRYYNDHPDEAMALVESLRASANDVEKAKVYMRQAKLLWKRIRNTVMQNILPLMNGSKIEKLTADNYVAASGEKLLEEVRIGTDTGYFCKIIYLFTIFMDSKEINDLLTTLINKFDNIDSFNDVARSQEIFAGFQSPYRMFAKADRICADLHAINSFARMSGRSAHARKAMFIEVAKVLGYDAEQDDLDKYFTNMMDNCAGKLNSGTKDTNFRNFLVNNVIDNNRFRYLVRYGNTEKIRCFARNRKVTLFVLKDIPDAQILRYYQACFGTEETNVPDMREKLANEIANINFRRFEDVDQHSDNPQKTMYQQIIRLYLTVLYLVTKNLVYVNSRYFLAFHCVERDREYYAHGKYDSKAAFAAFARDYLAEHPHNAHAQKYIGVNMEHADDLVIRYYRNAVDHLSAIRNADMYIDSIEHFSSYYELYHYLVQCNVKGKWEAERALGHIEDNDVSGWTEKYFGLIDRYHTYCKDFVKALNVPFAYNLARYKNLSIDGLFDMNDTREKPKGIKATTVKPDEE